MSLFVPVIIICLILLVITILLAIADRLLVDYGECRIVVHQADEQREFVVRGGSPLLTNLIENDVSISSSCAGKAICGYCKVKVLSGGGQILPTEEIFMTSDEKRDDMRLACQVKVKSDIEIYVPDILTTVREMIKSETYDPKLRWSVTKEGEAVPEMMKRRVKIAAEDEIRMTGIIEKYRDTPGAIVPVLQEINSAFNYLPEPVLRIASERMNMPLSEILRIATFYSNFSMEPRGRYVISVCTGTACYVKGAYDIISAFEDELGIKAGETTGDMLFTLDTVRCLGCCGLAPALRINDDVHGLMTEQKALELIEMCRGA